MRVAYLLSNIKVRTVRDIVAIPARSTREFVGWFSNNVHFQRFRAPYHESLKIVCGTVTLLASKLRFAIGPVNALCSLDARPLPILPAVARAKRELRPKQPIERVVRKGSSVVSSRSRARLLTMNKRVLKTRQLRGGPCPPVCRPVIKRRGETTCEKEPYRCSGKNGSPL